jgi:hypothetical protein
LSSSRRTLVRLLYVWEIQEAWRVFSNTLQYERIRIHECARWTNSINQFGSWLRRTPYTGIDNAVTLGNQCYFPVMFPEQFVSPDHPEFQRLPWLIHELTHVWQYQHMGWRYFFKAISAQVRIGSKAYRYGGEQALQQIHLQGFLLNDFNLEQQGEIARDYYRSLVNGLDISAYQPFIDQLQQTL